MATLTQPQFSLLSLFCSANFDKNRIIIADSDLNDQALTLYLEDKHDFKSNLEDTVKVEVSIERFAEIIKAEQLNSYEGTKFTEKGRAYADHIEIAEPITWFNEDASAYQREYTLDVVKAHLLKNALIN